MKQSSVEVLRSKDLREREAPVRELRRRFERESRRTMGRPWLKRLGRRAMVAYWCLCLAIIGAGANQLHPEFGHRVAYALADPAMDLSAPFPNCAAAHAAGYYDIPSGSPAYAQRQDGDFDGLACERFAGSGPRSSRAATVWRRFEHGPG